MDGDVTHQDHKRSHVRSLRLKNGVVKRIQRGLADGRRPNEHKGFLIRGQGALDAARNAPMESSRLFITSPLATSGEGSQVRQVSKLSPHWIIVILTQKIESHIRAFVSFIIMRCS